MTTHEMKLLCSSLQGVGRCIPLCLVLGFATFAAFGKFGCPPPMACSMPQHAAAQEIFLGTVDAWIRPGATKEDVKVAFEKMVLKLHIDKNKNNQETTTDLFKALNTTYRNWKCNAAHARQGGRNQAAPQPYHTNFQFNATYFTLNFCG